MIRDCKSWVAAANTPDTDFPIQNLPFASFRRAGRGEEFRGGVAIGDQILDLGALHSPGPLRGRRSAGAGRLCRTGTECVHGD